MSVEDIIEMPAKFKKILGYKETELGWIPEDWELKTFEDVIDGFSSGMTPYRAIKRFYSGNIPWITSGELNYNLILDTEEKITLEAVKRTNLKIIPKGTFLFAITGLEAEGTRGSCAITGIEATSNQSCMALYPKKGKLITNYLFHYYVRYGNELAFQYCQGTKQQSYTGRIAKKLPIIVPPSIHEQTAIATALSDMDGYISSLEKLIAKKRLIKQGTMQELLTPKEDWEERKLGEIGEFKNGINKGEDDFGFGYPFVNLLNVFGKQYVTETSNLGLVNSSVLERKLYNLKKGDILFIRSSVKPEGVGLTSLVTNNLPDTVFSGFLIRFRENGFLDYSYKIYCFNEEGFRRRLLDNSTISANTNINQNSLKQLDLFLPSLTEQKKIGEILQSMDMEISSIEQKLIKFKHLKQGMMQELLTGRIRLV